MKFTTQTEIVVSEVLGSTLDEIAHRLKEDVGHSPVIDDGIVITDVENLALVDTDKASAALKDAVEEVMEEFVRNDPSIGMETTVTFRL